MRPLVTAAVIAQNEQTHIAGCLETVAWADRLLVVDGGSSDATVTLAEKAGAQVVHHPFVTFPRQRNFALQQVTTPWVFFIDADERMDPRLAEEIRTVLAAHTGDRTGAPAGYWVPRRNIILGRWIRHAGWWPDYQLRLFRTEGTRYHEYYDPHELLLLEGERAYLTQPLIHYSYRSVRQLISRQERYARHEAAGLVAMGRTARRRALIGGPAREFYWRWVSMQGYREGYAGLVLCLAMAWFRFRVVSHVRRMQAGPWNKGQGTRSGEQAGNFEPGT